MRFALALLFLAGTAFAQEPERRVEITPFAGYQFGGESLSRRGQLGLEPDASFGVMLDVRVRPDATIQVLYDRQATILDFRDQHPLLPRRVLVDLAVEYYHLGGTLELAFERFRPYIVLTAGANRFDPDAEGVSSEWRFGVGLGGGLKTYLSDRFGLRVDGRVWPSFVNTDGGLFCSLPGACLVEVQTDFLTQGNATAGFFLTF